MEKRTLTPDAGAACCSEKIVEYAFLIRGR